MYPTDYRIKVREVHKQYNQRSRLRYFIVNSSDKNVVEYRGSTDFKINIPEDLKGQDQRNFSTITFIRGVIPNILQQPLITKLRPHLFLKILEVESNVINANLDGKATSVISYTFNNTETGQFLETLEYTPMENRFVGKGISETLTFQLYSSTGVLYDFGNSFYRTNFITPGNPTIIDIGPHVLQINDLVYLRFLRNASSIYMSNLIVNNEPWIVTAIAATSITIGALNTTTEAANQPPTGTPAAYPLGINSFIKDITNGQNFTGATYTLANPTIIGTLSALPHNFNTGDTVLISGFDNGSTSLINQLVNQQHIITVLTPTTFSISVDLSTQLANQPPTGSPSAFPLGQGMLVLDAKKQVSFNFLLEVNYNDYPIN